MFNFLWLNLELVLTTGQDCQLFNDDQKNGMGERSFILQSFFYGSR